MSNKLFDNFGTKGISSVLAAVLFATVSVALVGTTYYFSKGVMEGTIAETFEVIDIFGDRVIVRNTGTHAIEKLMSIVDGNDIQNEMDPIEPGKVGTVRLIGITEGRHELVLISRSMSQRWIWEVKVITATTTSTTTTITTTSSTSTSTTSTSSTTTTTTPRACTMSSDCCEMGVVGWWECHKTEYVCDSCSCDPCPPTSNCVYCPRGGIEVDVVETEQGSAEIGKPVKWTSQIEVSNPSSAEVKDYLLRPTIPEDASNIQLKDKEKKAIGQTSISVDVKENENLTYFVEYETPAPYKIEKEGSEFIKEGYVKTVRVINNASIHYKNVKVFTKFYHRNFRLYHIIGFPVDVTKDPRYQVNYIDDDRVEWTVPELSEQVFVLQAEPEISILQTEEYDISDVPCNDPTPSCECFAGPPLCVACDNDADCIVASCTVTCPSRPYATVAYDNCSSTVASSSGCTNSCYFEPDCYPWQPRCHGGTCTATCNAATGACYYNCESGYGDCNGNSTDGCEIDLMTNSDHCGECNNSCGANAYCDTGNCVCNPGWYNDDGDNINGCENQAPYWYTPSVNSSSPQIRDVLSFNVNWTDTTGVNTSFGLGVNFTILSLNGTGPNCNEWKNFSIGRNNVQSLWSNITWEIPDQCAGKTIAWKQYANDSAGRWNVSEEKTITLTKGWLNVTLLEPNPLSCNEINPCEWCAYFIKHIEAEVECKENRCGFTDATARRNSTDVDMIPISLMNGQQPFYILNESNTVTYDLVAEEKQRILWEVNVSSCIIEPWKINVFSNSSSLILNETNNATIKIVSGTTVEDVMFNVTNFEIHDPIECSANIIDPKNKTYYIYYMISDTSGNYVYNGKIYDKDTGLNNCTGDGDWTNGEYCTAVVPDAIGWKGQWSCNITAECLCGNSTGPTNYTTMINTLPPKSNIIQPANNTWFNKYTNSVDVICTNETPDVNLEDSLSFTIEWHNGTDWNTVCTEEPSGQCSWDLTEVNDGDRYLRCRAWDGANYSKESDYIVARVDRTDPTCILDISNITVSPYLLKGIYDDVNNVTNVTYWFYNETHWNKIGTNSTEPFTWNWNVSNVTPSLENKWIYVNATCNDTIGNSVTNYTYVAVDLENEYPKIWNLIVRNEKGEPLPYNRTNPGVLIMITVNTSDSDPVRGIDYVVGNFIDVNDGYSDYENFTEEVTSNYTYVWNYPLWPDAGPGQAYINVTVHDRNGTSNKRSTNITINEFAEIVLGNTPINFSLASPGEEVNATENMGWPLNITVGGNVPLNLYQNGTDLTGKDVPSFMIGVKNITWNQTESGMFNPLNYSFTWIAEKIPLEYQEVFYKIRIPTVIRQYYSGNVSIKGEYNG